MPPSITNDIDSILLGKPSVSSGRDKRFQMITVFDVFTRVVVFACAEGV